MTSPYFQIDRQRALCAAQYWLTHNAIVLDTETTGLDWGCEVVEVAAVEVATGNVLMNTLVKPTRPIPAEAEAIHHISNEMVADMPGMDDVIRDINMMLAGRHVVAYNAAFDRKMLMSSLTAYPDDELHFGLSINKGPLAWHCGMLTYAAFKGDWNHSHGDYRWHSLVNAAKQQGISIPGNPHRALYDCMLTRELILKMAEAA